MRVLLVNKFHYRKGGAEAYYLGLGEGLARRGHQVAYFSMQHPQNLPCEQERYFVSQREYNAPKGLLSTMRDGLALVYSRESRTSFDQLLRSFKPDIVHLNNVHRQITLSILDAPALCDTPVVYTAHDPITVCPNYELFDGTGHPCRDCLGGHFSHCARKRCIKGSRAKSCLATFEAEYLKLRHSYRRVDKVISPSRFLQKTLVEGGWPPDKVIWRQNFVDAQVRSQAERAIDHTDHGNPYLLFFGRLSWEKGVDVLMGAFAEALPRLSAVPRLVIAGDGPMRADLEGSLVGSCLKERISFVGFKQGEELRRLVEGATLSVTCTRPPDNMPYSIVESFAAGTPVVGTRSGGIPELVLEGQTGFLSQPDDVHELATTLVRATAACNDAALYHRLQESCRTYVRERCSSGAYLDWLEELYGGLTHA